MTQSWQTVTIFISSTFSDMHAERDFLVKSVFPRLSEWCADRKLRLVDIDLRWGVTEQDAQQNKNVVKVCLDRIDDCRPFFLCFLGQRRGWVPEEEHISSETLETFPGIQEYIGNTSITEMEILHALASPIIRAGLGKPVPSEHSFFYLRDPAYLAQFPGDTPELRYIFTNEPAEKDPPSLAEQKLMDEQLAEWRERVIPGLGRPVRTYTCRWDREAQSPELGPKAAAWSADLTSGRLVDFQTSADGRDLPLDEAILEDLQAAIASRFPEHMEAILEGDLQAELDQQEQFLFASSEGFIARGNDFKELDSYLAGDSHQAYLLSAPAGTGKSTLLANWITKLRGTSSLQENTRLLYRFIAASDHSTTVTDLIQYLLRELKEIQGTYTGDIPTDPQELRRAFPEILRDQAADHKLILLLDGLNQLESGLTDLSWLPWSVPENLKLILSFKSGVEEGDALLERLSSEHTAILSEVQPFHDLEDRRRLVNNYLSRYLKDLDEKHMESLIRSPGAGNPLYLKVVLSELRVFGVFEDLGRKIQDDFGETPISAFQAVLERMETDPGYTSLEPHRVVPLLFGLLAHARKGLSAAELTSIFLTELGLADNPTNRKEIAESIHTYLRQMRPFLAKRDQRYDFFFESFRIAARQRCATREEGVLKLTYKPSPAWHALLADYFSSLPLWESPDKTTPTLRKVSELPYHLGWSGSFAALTAVLSDFEFLAAKGGSLGPVALLEDYDLFQLPAPAAPEGVSQDALEEIALIQRAISLSTHVLSEDPAQIPSQLYGRLHSLQGTLIDRIKRGIEGWDQPWLRPTVPSLTSPASSLVRLIPTAGGPILKVVLSPDGRWGAASNVDFFIEIWDLVRGIKIGQLELDALDEDDSLALSADGRYLLIRVESDETLQLWELEGLTELPLARAEINGISYHFDPEEDRLLEDWPQPTHLSGDDFVIAGSQDQADPGIKIHFGALNNVEEHESSDGRYSFQPVFESTLGLYDQSIQSESALIRPFPGHPDAYVIGLALSPNGIFGASLSLGNEVKFWGLEEGIELCAVTANATTLAFTPDSQQLVTLGELLQVWDVEIFDDLVREQTQTGGIQKLVVSPDGRKAIGAAFTAHLRAWDLQSGKELDPILDTPGILHQIAITPDGRTAVVADIGNSLLVWDLERGLELEKIPDPFGASAISITPDGRRFAAGGGDQILIHEPSSGEQRTLSTRHFKINDLALSPDGRRLLTVCSDRSLELWDVERGEILVRFTGENPFTCCALAENGCYLMAGEESGLIHILKVEGLPPTAAGDPSPGQTARVPDSAEHRTQQALEMGQSGEHEAALNAYNQLLEAYPENVAGHIDKIDLLFTMGRFQEAVEHAEETLKLQLASPQQQAELHHWHGNSLYQLGEIELAILAYDQAIKINPDNFLFWYNRGMAYSKLQYFESALDDFLQARRLDPTPQVSIQIAQCHMMLDEYERAIYEYSKLIEDGYEDPRFYYMLGVAYSFTGDMAHSRQNLEHFLKAAGPELASLAANARQMLGLN